MRFILNIFLLLAIGIALIGAVVQSGSSSLSGRKQVLRRQRFQSHRFVSKTDRTSDAVSHAYFAIRLHALLSSQNVDVDVAFSPLSIASLLYALAEGANGTTATEIYAALNRTGSGVDVDTFNALRHRWMSAAIDGLRNEPSVLTATKIFHAPSFNVKPDYIDRLQSRYRIKSEPLDFATSTDDAERAVNAWVADETRQRIQNLVPAGTFDPLTVLVFVNALFFKADWQTKFDISRTKLRPFHTHQSSAVSETRDRAVTTMHVVDEFPYRDFRRLHFEMLELPYSSAGSSSCSMFVILPYRDSSLSSVVRYLLRRPIIIAQPRRRLFNETVSVFLPRFTVNEDSIDLKAALGGLGIVQAFQQGRADLSQIDGIKGLHVSDALHKVFIEVDERGSRASAATAIVVKGRSMSSDPIFNADRPFMFFIRHNPTASILFMGNVAHPRDTTSASHSLPSTVLQSDSLDGTTGERIFYR